MLARVFKPYSHAQAHGSLRPSYQEVNTITRLQQAWGGQVKPASYGPPGEGKVRWCASCAESHPGARCLSNPCEDCQRKTADYVSRGEIAAGVLLVRSHMQGRNCRSNSCEDCQMKPASYDTLGEGKRRWCASCAESHPGARCLTGESREACQMKTASTHLDGCSLSARQVRPKRPQLNQRDDLPYAPLVNDAVAAAMAGIAVAPALGDQDRRRLRRLQSKVLNTVKIELGELKVSSALAEEQIMAMRSREQIDTVSSAAVVAQDVLSDVHSAVEFDGGDTFAIDAIQQPVIGQHVADGGLFVQNHMLISKELLVTPTKPSLRPIHRRCKLWTTARPRSCRARGRCSTFLPRAIVSRSLRHSTAVCTGARCRKSGEREYGTSART